MGTPFVKEALAFRAILDDFAQASGSSVNNAKSKLFFLNTSNAIQINITRILGFQLSYFPSKYLGVPLTDKPLARGNSESLVSKLQKQISNWTFCSLNFPSKLVLVRSVLQAMPQYQYSHCGPQIYL